MTLIVPAVKSISTSARRDIDMDDDNKKRAANKKQHHVGSSEFESQCGAERKTRSRAPELRTTTAGCADTLAQTVNVNVSPTALYNDTIHYPFNGIYTDESFITQGSIVSWAWDFGDSTVATVQNPIHTYPDSGMYIVTLAVTSDSGCVSVFSDTTFIMLYSDAVTDPVLPSAFTPNGDGHNDAFYVRGGPMQEMTLNVFNEWDNLIFTSTSQTYGWDGTYKGKPQPAGTYIWTLTGTTMAGTPINMYGSVTILR